MNRPTIECTDPTRTTTFGELETGEFFLYNNVLWIVLDMSDGMGSGTAYCLDDDGLGDFAPNDVVSKVKVYIRYSRAD